MEVISLIYLPNRRIPNGTYGGVRGRWLVTASYSIGFYNLNFQKAKIKNITDSLEKKNTVFNLKYYSNIEILQFCKRMGIEYKLKILQNIFMR